eukprot:2952594-Pleurochrysis_carterae.AAC.1
MQRHCFQVFAIELVPDVAPNLDSPRASLNRKSFDLDRESTLPDGSYFFLGADLEFSTWIGSFAAFRLLLFMNRE